MTVSSILEEPTENELKEALESLVEDCMHEGDFSAVIDQKADSDRLATFFKRLLDNHDPDELWALRDDARAYMQEITHAYYQTKEELVLERAYELMDEATA
jgi:hypothetical protein